MPPSFCPECGVRSQPTRTACWSCGVVLLQQRRKPQEDSSTAALLRYFAAFATAAGLAGALAVSWANGWAAPVKTIGLVLLSAVVAAGILIYLSDAFEALARRRSQGNSSRS